MKIPFAGREKDGTTFKAEVITDKNGARYLKLSGKKKAKKKAKKKTKRKKILWVESPDRIIGPW